MDKHYGLEVVLAGHAASASVRCRFSLGWRTGDAVSVQNVVLGELISRRGYGYGYELRDQLLEFTAALGYSDTVVYAALDALERRGLVRVVERDAEAVGGGRQASMRVYHEATDEGRTHFRDWMASTPKKAPLREELHRQLIAATRRAAVFERPDHRRAVVLPGVLSVRLTKPDSLAAASRLRRDLIIRWS